MTTADILEHSYLLEHPIKDSEMQTSREELNNTQQGHQPRITQESKYQWVEHSSAYYLFLFCFPAET